MEETLKFDRKRQNAKYCPCNKSNRDGKFAPFKGFINKGYCFSCDKTFLPDKGNIVEPLQYKPLKPKPPSYHPLELVKNSVRHFNQNNFVQFLKTLFGEDEIKSAISKYFIGTSKYWNGATVFWQIDNVQKVRHGKIIRYNSKTGKKLKKADGKAYISSVRSALKLNDFNLKQCLFGLHLINETKNRTVALVEGEKTAVIMSIFKPEYMWLATGGITGLNWENMKLLKECKIIAYPDKNAYTIWENKSNELKKYGLDISVSRFIEDRPYPNNTDLADVYIDLRKRKEVKNKAQRSSAETIVLKFVKINPALKTLIQEFELTDINGQAINV